METRGLIETIARAEVRRRRGLGDCSDCGQPMTRCRCGAGEGVGDGHWLADIWERAAGGGPGMESEDGDCLRVLDEVAP